MIRGAEPSRPLGMVDGPPRPDRERVQIPSLFARAAKALSSTDLDGVIPCGVLFCFALIILLTRLSTFQMPANVDVSLGQVIGHELLEGRKLYTEVWDHRPPLIYLVYSLAELLVGWGDGQLLLLGTCLSVITMLGVWYAGATLSAAAGLIAAAFWVALQGDIGLEAQHPNGEAFLNAALAWALELLLRGRCRWGPAVLFAVATLTKE